MRFRFEIFILVPLIFNCATTKVQPKIESLKGYFSVDADGGLRLRENPTIQSKVILTIPEGRIINVIEEIGETETNDNKEGKWVKAKYGNITGYVFNPFLLKVKKDLQYLKENSIKLAKNKSHTKIFETLIENKLPEPYDQNKDRRPNKQFEEFLTENYAERNGYSVITISPRRESCSGYLHSYCYNFIIKNGKVISTDMNGESYGEFVSISKKAAFFNISGGEGDECGGGGESYTVAFVFKTETTLVERSGWSETCPNECPCSKPKKFNKTVYEYFNGKGTPTDSELRGIFK
ncbi:SH3 domain-containing protein [Leptospira interrogans]|uniref:Sh3 type 3 domain protein n=1 Tax=Leptospira interrogans serovar Canicola TaxID=211880 RepID=A0A067YD52_LEPIR|nr:SH3 domain-containing protein [Leptospira interrogans]AGZ84953.1 sh3 type 3 domain protein [Leptospira interrogans serovar Canicola]EKO70233.1 SH3 domain protein [Leptospira interrogans serovar Canicola str. Fiocruz LV133]EMK23195.1 SH3 domain protein [Leptospira interrogans str. Kito]MCR8628355.1 peptide-binding protein [Leptospira interrogans serovar Canicola]OLZ32076.1 SH3 domain-containing protein [Leptospira interrogans serovar Canicola]